MSAKIAKERLRWIVQADRIKHMDENLKRVRVWWVPDGMIRLL